MLTDAMGIDMYTANLALAMCLLVDYPHYGGQIRNNYVSSPIPN